MPFSSSAFTRDASVNRGGGSVKCCFGVTSRSRSFSPTVSGGFLINSQEAVEFHDAPVFPEQVILRRNLNGRLIVDRRVHLRSDESSPDQAIELQLILREKLFQVVGRPANEGRTNGLMGVLGVFLALIENRFLGQVIRAVDVGHI